MLTILPPGLRGLSGARAGTPGGMLPFADRRAAGLLLAERVRATVALDHWPERAMVLALPRGGGYASFGQLTDADVLALLA